MGSACVREGCANSGHVANRQDDVYITGKTLTPTPSHLHYN